MGNNVVRVDFTIQKELVEKLADFKKRTMIPKSQLVSKLLNDFFDKESKTRVKVIP
jgi:metal-responsive CopG/Arc/MetJ family transcriptional regulator